MKNFNYIKEFLVSSFISILMLSSIAVSQTVKIPVSEITTNIKHYTYSHILSQTQKKDIEYIVIKASNGDIKSCFNACDVCYPQHKGYSQSNTDLRCNNCGNRFAIDGLGSQGSGGCWPGHLPHTLEGDNVVINVSDLIKGDYFFLTTAISGINDETNNNFAMTVNLNLQPDKLTVKFSKELERFIRIVSLTGRIYSSGFYNSAEANFNVSDLSSGLYFLAVEENGIIYSKTFCISK